MNKCKCQVTKTQKTEWGQILTVKKCIHCEEEEKKLVSIIRNCYTK